MLISVGRSRQLDNELMTYKYIKILHILVQTYKNIWIKQELLKKGCNIPDITITRRCLVKLTFKERLVSRTIEIYIIKLYVLQNSYYIH